jgi:hypothetical protein
MPVWDGTAATAVREAGPAELAKLEIAQLRAVAEREDDEFTFAFLIPLDSEPS